MPVPAVAITTAPLDLQSLTAVVVANGDGLSRPESSGAIASFVGVVRNQNAGRRVLFLEYEAYEALAIKALDRIVGEARDAWPDTRLALHHRIGRLDVGDASVIIAAASPHRAHAFAACRYAIERVKQIVPIWKREHFEGGEVWLEGATADPQDEAARDQALRIACA